MKVFNAKTSMASLFLLLLLSACSQQNQGSETAPAATPEGQGETQSTSQQRWEKDGLVVTAMPDSPKFPSSQLTINGIDDRADFPVGPMTFDFDVSGFEIGAQTSDAEGKGLANSAQGQHIHLILNNGPYSAHYEADFEKEMAEGHYVMLAFLSRSYHESVKAPGAAVVRQFTVGSATAIEADLNAPHLFYSRPKGVYSGDGTKNLMLDFYLLNTTISPDGNKVRATVNGTEFVFSAWVPYVIEGLPMGEVTIGLELIDNAGNLIPGPFNQVTRTVTLEAGE